MKDLNFWRALFFTAFKRVPAGEQELVEFLISLRRKLDEVLK